LQLHEQLALDKRFFSLFRFLFLLLSVLLGTLSAAENVLLAFNHRAVSRKLARF
jgi:hypothetical protein